MNSQEICKRIRSVREIRHIKQSEMAEHLGLSQSSYAKIENGATKLSLDRFLQIAKYLDTDPDFYFREIPKPASKKFKPYKQEWDPRKSQWEEHLSHHLYVVAKQNEELVELLDGINPRSA